MSRIGKKPVVIPNGVEVKISDRVLSVKGPKGTLTMTLHPNVSAALAEVEGAKQLNFQVAVQELKSDRALWGLFRSLGQNLVTGVTVGFQEKLEVNGIGFKVAAAPKKLTLDVGFSHEVVFDLPEGITATVDKNLITITGIDKQLVGETAARIRRIKKPEPYQGKGIKYVDEIIRRKAGKAATKAAA